MCNEAVEEQPFSLWVVSDHLLKFGHLEDEKKETDQYNTQEMCNDAVEEDPSSLRLVPNHLKHKKCVKTPSNVILGV